MSYNDIQTALNAAIARFQFADSEGNRFWAPYLRNDNYTEMGPKFPRGVGKTHPDKIAEAVEYIKQTYPDISGEQIRQKLIDGTLPEQSMNYRAIECSGFTYYVMDYVYRQLFDKPLSDILFVPRESVLNGALNYVEWQQAHEITPEEAENMSQDVPMTWVVETFKRQPANLCNVKALVSDSSSDKISAEQAQIGDLVHMSDKSDGMPHVAIVTKVSEDEVEVVHSGRVDGEDTGGVRFDTLKRAGETLDCTNVHSPHEFIAVRRLKS